MKSTTIAAMVLAAAAASAATIVALKKAHDKRQREEEELECDSDYDCVPDEKEDTSCADAAASEDSETKAVENGCCCADTETCEDSDCETDTVSDSVSHSNSETETVDSSCCADGVCSFSPEEDDTADQPAMLHMPEELLDESDLE